MQNKISTSIPFTAKLQSFVKLSDSKKMEQVKKLVEKETKSYPNKKLFISPTGTDSVLSFHTTSKSLNKSDFFDGMEIFVDTKIFDLKNMSAQKLAKTFVDFFKFLISVEKNEPNIAILQKEITKARNIADTYVKKADKIELPQISQMYRVLANRKLQHIEKMENRINKMSKQYNEETDIFLKKYPKITLGG